MVIPSGTTRELPQITSTGLNVLLYPNSGLYISNNGLESHRITIANLDLLNNIVTLKIESTPQLVTLKLNEAAKVDLDGDGISDISIRFTNVKINLMELTIKSISGEAPVVTTPVKPAIYDLTLANKLKGQILLQVQSHGEAWYINPTDAKKYYLADGVAAYNIMRSLSSGITNANLQKLKTNSTFRKKFLGKIFLQVEAHGEAYYIGFDNKLYYLKNGAAAYQIMRTKGLGISNSNLEKIQSGALKN